MPRRLIVSAALIAFLGSHQIFAADPVLVGGVGRSGHMYINPGAYRQIEENVTESAKKAMDLVNVTQNQDRDFVLGAVNEIHQAYVEYANKLISGEILQLEARGVAGNTTDLDTFMKQTTELKAKKAAFESLLVKNASINKAVLPSNYEVIITSDGTKQQVASPGQINLSSVVDKYHELIKNELDPQLASYTHIKIDVYGQVLGIEQYKNILNPDFRDLPTLNVDKKEELTAKMVQLRNRSGDLARNERIEFADAVRAEYNDFARRYGSDYRYVYRSGNATGKFPKLDKVFKGIFGSDESRTTPGKGNTPNVPGISLDTDITARNASFKRMIDMWWVRSYQRLVDGQQICALQPKMVAATNLGAFEAIEALKELRTEPACTKNELENALENARRIMIYSGAQAAYVFDDKGFLEAGLLNRLGSAVTFALGNRPAAEALNMLIQLVYADIQEELLMATPGQGLQALHSMYRARYQSSPEQKEYYAKIKCSIDKTADCADKDDAFSETSSVGMAGDVRRVFLDLKAKIQLQKDFIDQANRIDATLQAARSDSEQFKNSTKRAKDL